MSGKYSSLKYLPVGDQRVFGDALSGLFRRAGYLVELRQNFITFGNKDAKKLATKSAELFPLRGMQRKGKNALSA